jgi:hypothetical protein
MLSNGFRAADDIQAALNKKSFELNYNGGTIWCEHLDGMGNHEQEVIEKFKGDLPKLMRPSVSSCMIINLDETKITEAVANAIVDGLVGGNKKLRKIAFVGVGKRYYAVFNEIHNRSGTIVRFIADYEKAKEWVL